MIFSQEQTDDALAVMQQYLDHPPNFDGKTPEKLMAALDQERANWIDTELKPLVEQFLNGTDSLETFKWQVNAFNIRHKVSWGFLGPNGQLFFNMLVNATHDDTECEKQTREAVKMPAHEDAARGQMRTFEEFVCRVRQAHKSAHGTMRGCPKVGSIPFFLSYFWQIQDRQVWPIYYTNAVNTMVDLVQSQGTPHATCVGCIE